MRPPYVSARRSCHVRGSSTGTRSLAGADIIARMREAARAAGSPPSESPFALSRIAVSVPAAEFLCAGCGGTRGACEQAGAAACAMSAAAAEPPSASGEAAGVSRAAQMSLRVAAAAPGVSSDEAFWMRRTAELGQYSGPSGVAFRGSWVRAPGAVDGWVGGVNCFLRAVHYAHIHVSVRDACVD